MPLPSINITFRTLAASAIQRSQKGVVALVVRGKKLKTGASYTSANELPADWLAASRAYAVRAFTGYQTPPRKVIVYMIDGEDLTMQDALNWMALQQFDYLAGPPDIIDEEKEAIASWIKSERLKHHQVKAVLPNMAADHEGIINFTTEGIKVGEDEYTAAEYSSRIAGLIAGTPMTISCTYAPLPEVTDVERKTLEELDAAVDRGEFVLLHDGEKVKVGRGVNSLVTTTQDKGKSFQKIKIVEVVDMVDRDIRTTAQDNYIGKYSNSYDNKCLLFLAVEGYLEELERQEILERGRSSVGIALEAQETYLKSQGTDTESMSDQEIKEANTGAKVFMGANIKPLDAIEDIDMGITM